MRSCLGPHQAGKGELGAGAGAVMGVGVSGVGRRVADDGFSLDGCHPLTTIPDRPPFSSGAYTWGGKVKWGGVSVRAREEKEGWESRKHRAAQDNVSI